MPSCNSKKYPKSKICKTKTCDDVKCEDGKICNPKTFRCIKIKETKRKNDSISKKSNNIIKNTMNDKLYFYSKSRDVAPGKGTNEVVENVSLYEELTKIKDWRKILSNFHMCPFKYEGYTYNTIEHVFQAKKIEIVDKEKAHYFTLESGHDIGQGDGEIARKNRKLVKLDNDELKLWATMKDKVMHDAALQKYMTCKEAQNVLKATNGSQLWHIVSRSKPVRFEHLEKIRSLL